MFKAIKEFFTGKPAVVETPATEVPYKVETPAAVIGVEGAGAVAKIAKKSPPNATAWRIENAVTAADSKPAKKRAAKPRAKKSS